MVSDVYPATPEKIEQRHEQNRRIEQGIQQAEAQIQQLQRHIETLKAQRLRNDGALEAFGECKKFVEDVEKALEKAEQEEIEPFKPKEEAINEPKDD